jgi:hypothetical protein
VSRSAKLSRESLVAENAVLDLVSCRGAMNVTLWAGTRPLAPSEPCGSSRKLRHTYRKAWAGVEQWE